MNRSEFWRFWAQPLVYVEEICKEIDVPLKDIVKEAGVDFSSWRRWRRGECEPSFRKFQEIVWALAKHTDQTTEGQPPDAG